MALFSTPAVTSFITCTFILVAWRFLQRSLIPYATKLKTLDVTSIPPESVKLSKDIAAALPESTILPQDITTFQKSLDRYWAQQECEVVPACIVRPQNAHELSTAITILKRQFDTKGRQADISSRFAIRGGGHSPVPGAASIQGGILIDLSLFREVTVSDDQPSVVIGAGAKWGEVSRILDSKGLAVVGGRNADVGAAGLALGGGISWFSSTSGLVCSNIISYDVVLASGVIVKASKTQNPDLWRALKGGANNFGVVVCFETRSFPATDIWSGFLYMPSSQTDKLLSAFHGSVNQTDSNDAGTLYDKHTSGPIACFSYIYPLGIEVLSVNLVHTRPPKNTKQWPRCWKDSSFASLWRFWSTCKVRTLTDALEEMVSLNPDGRRQIFTNTTIKNDFATINAAHRAYREAIAPLRKAKVKGLVWTFVLQPLLPVWARLGDPNPLGLDKGSDEPLVIVSFTVNWNQSQHDEIVRTTLRHTIERIEAIAEDNKVGHPYRFMNYCADWQNPFDGYGQENYDFLRNTSKKYDPDGLFQKGCVGGFKLWPSASKA